MEPVSDKIEIAARIYRGPHVEAVHYASVAVVDETGRVTHYLGDPELVTMMRSSIKPFQALPFLISGAADHFKFSNKQLAIMCGSHVGTDEHVETVLANLTAADNLPSHLDCGAHLPIGMQIEGQYPTRGEDKDPLRHNCSGKHSGFLALARYLGDPPGEYLNPTSKIQLAIRKALAEACEYPEEKLVPAIDGCSAPNYPMPISHLALGFRKFANGEGQTKGMREAFTRLKIAITEFPHMVSGEKRFDLNLMRSFPGNVVCKGGAESLQAIGFSEPRLGIAIKVLDGGPRALAAITVEVLRQLGLISDFKKFPHLEQYVRPEIRNNRNRHTGNIVADFTLHRVG
jgi:L-asparaginase II